MKPKPKKRCLLMPDRAALKTEQIRADLLKSLKRLYDSADHKIQADIEELLLEIYLDDESATQRQRIQHAERNGLNEIIDIFVAVMLLTNERAIRRINNAANNVASVNYGHVRDKVTHITGIDIRGTAEEFEGTRYTRRAYNRATQSKFVSDAAMKQIEAGLKRGETSKEISKRLQKAVNLSRNSANNTGVTETTRIRSESRLEAMQQAEKRGIKMVKIWRHSPHVKAPRDWHMAQDGDTKPLDEPFIVDGIEMQQPGDPNGGAANNCYCHCYLDERVESW